MSAERLPSPLELLRRRGLRPSKKLGQHFLVNPGVLSRILEAAELSPADAVLEIGAGLGVLSLALAPRVGRLVAVEFDRGVAALLRETLSSYRNAEVVEGDILEMDVPALMGYGKDVHGRGEYKVVANLPYYITSPIMRRLLEARVWPRLLVLMVQKEVAQRIVAGPGNMSLLAVSVQFYGRPSIAGYVSPGSFSPPPKVESAILKIETYAKPAGGVVDTEGFFKVVQAGFGQRRKQLRNALAAGLTVSSDQAAEILRKAGIDERRRAEELSIDEWVRLARAAALTDREAAAGT